MSDEQRKPESDSPTVGKVQKIRFKRGPGRKRRPPLNKPKEQYDG